MTTKVQLRWFRTPPSFLMRYYGFFKRKQIVFFIGCILNPTEWIQAPFCDNREVVQYNTESRSLRPPALPLRVEWPWGSRKVDGGFLYYIVHNHANSRLSMKKTSVALHLSKPSLIVQNRGFCPPMEPALYRQPGSLSRATFANPSIVQKHLEYDLREYLSYGFS